ncbi:hypothetical protein [Rhizobium sp. LC145]|uniref:hypothetical protein n=1 Tax=Rhizobium sp. LC145 TaxID=1120688 RepID=UPI000629E886|nr:hypothetical protein [Rhizobium sp. LC145]KKX25410.1 hypothetical protein YH62_26140 [Rhizobium sp. LC145]TKT42566.1 hypothetical protein FDR95_28780 [Rhizobiaceae bacterium LC148]
MSIELSTLDERAEAEEAMAEAMRILNKAIRRVHESGLTVDVEVLTMLTGHGQMPQVSVGTHDRQNGAI